MPRSSLSALLTAFALGSIVTAAPPQEAGAASPSAARERSVVFYLMDTCRNDRMAFRGYERETTPFLKWIAERSVVFDTCYSQAPWTKPSMASMLSSSYPADAAAHKLDYQLPDEVLTWPEVLQANDMYTAGFSANIVMGDLLSNYAQGFSYFVESNQINRGDPIRFASGSAAKLNESIFPWLDRNDHWPLLLYVHSVDPHEEYEPAMRYLEQFAEPQRHPQFRREWKKLLQSRPPIPGLFVTQDNFDRTEVDAPSFIEHGSNLYDADILANDEQIRLLWDKLQQDGWGEDFIFVFTSDHGEEFFEHGGTSHGYSLYEEMTRVPLMIYAPGLLPAGKRIEAPVRSIDIYPTLCDLLDFDLPHGLEGESLLPLILEDGPHPQRPVYSMRREDPLLRTIGLGLGDMVSLRQGNWKLILNQENAQVLPRPRLQLFDVVEDPGMLRNVAADHPKVVKQMEAEILAFIAAHWSEVSGGQASTLDPAVRSQLEALGYLGDEESSGPDLWEALKSQDDARIGQALKDGADPERQETNSGITPLTLAALINDVELAQVLRDAGAEIDTRNRDGSTALSAAAFFGRTKMLRFLLQHGADPAATNSRGDTILSATQVPWEITEFIAAQLKISLDRLKVEASRKVCAALLRAALKKR